MASRQNRETRKEYPTGHNKGNDSPDRSVPRANGGNDDEVATFGTPISGPPPVVDDSAQRAALLATTGEGGTAAEHIESHIQGGVDESAARDRAEQEADERRSISAEDNPTGDMTATGAAKHIRERQQETEETDR